VTPRVPERFQILSTPPQVNADGPLPQDRFAVIESPDEQLFTPEQAYLDALRRTLPIIDLDPCSSPRRQALIEAGSWFPVEAVERSFEEPWHGRIFLQVHPSARIARQQIRKLLKEYLTDRCSEAILLICHTELHRREPLLFSFPFAIHYRRLPMVRWSEHNQSFVRVNTAAPATTFYLPRKLGIEIDEDRLRCFCENFRSFGRILLTEELPFDWQADCHIGTAHARIKPLLTRRFNA